MNEPMEVLKLRLPPKLLSQIGKQADREERTIQDMIRRLLNRAMNGKAKR